MMFEHWLHSPLQSLKILSSPPGRRRASPDSPAGKVDESIGTNDVIASINWTICGANSRQVTQLVYKWLNRQSQRSSYNWTRFLDALT
jgi:hypothetical protein